MTFRCQAILFDLDGTLIDSIAAVDRAWSHWAVRHGLDPAVIVPQIHGRRAIDSMRLLAPHLDVEAEDIWLRSIEATDTEGIVPIAGALEFVASIPRHRWAVVTSGASDGWSGPPQSRWAGSRCRCLRRRREQWKTVPRSLSARSSETRL